MMQSEKNALKREKLAADYPTVSAPVDFIPPELPVAEKLARLAARKASRVGRPGRRYWY